MNINDGFQNVVANLGTARDKAAHGEYSRPQYSQQEQFNIAYEYAWLPRRVVSQVAEDAFRKWREWNAKPEQITAIEREEKRLKLRDIGERAYNDARLRGKSFVYISVKGDENNVDKPLNLNRIRLGDINHLTHLTRDDVADGEIDIDPISPTFGEPQYYEIASTQLTRIHPSRLVVFKGDPRPASFLRGAEANSVLSASMDAIKRHDATVANIASLVYEARVDVITVPGLAEMLVDPDEEQRLMRRFSLMAQMKGNNGLVMLNGSASPDSPSEEWEQKNTTFATLPDIIEKAQEEVSAAARIPRALLFGVSTGGMGSTGDLELSNYYDFINTIQTNHVEPSMNVLDEALIRSALGDRPDDVWYDWRSLWQMSDKEKAEIGKMIADKWKVAIDAGLPPDAAIPSLVNDLTETGVGGGVEQHFNDWLATGGDDLEQQEGQPEDGTDNS
jgi:phage-related protein (TIGR01555 family)